MSTQRLISIAFFLIAVMLTARSASACATSARAPGRSSSWTVNQTDTGYLLAANGTRGALVEPGRREDRTIDAVAGSEIQQVTATPGFYSDISWGPSSP